MAKFAHMADVHLGGWKQGPLQELNFQAFKKAIDICIESKVDFVLIAGDLFDSAYPGIEILKQTFAQFKRLKDARIPCFLIAGSHDYSVSGKTFLDVLEKAGFCKNVANFEERGESIYLNPTIYEGVAIYGYPGRMAGLEIPMLRKIKLNDSPGMFKVLMLHTVIDKAKGTLPTDAVETSVLPSADYYALGHLHIDFQYEKFVYPGPIFPNNFQELEDLQGGGFYIVDTSVRDSLKRVDLKLKQVVRLEFDIKNALDATESIILQLSKRELEDKIVLLRLKGEFEQGRISDIKFSQIQDFARQKGAYFLLKNTRELKPKRPDFEVRVGESENVEEEVIRAYSEKNPSKFNSKIIELMEALSVEKQEGETKDSFANKILESSRKVLGF